MKPQQRPQPKRRAPGRIARPGGAAPISDLNPFAPCPFDSPFRPGLIEGWRRRNLSAPTPIQRRAMERLRAESPGEPRNWLILAPTGSGKTAAAEIALAESLSRGRKAVYLVPTRALAEEKLRDFTRWLAPAGLRALCATRERPDSDPMVARGEFDLLVAIYEKLDHYLVAAPAIFDHIGCVVADEIQMIADEDRGGTLDLILTRLRLAAPSTRLVGLTSAMRLEDAREMSRWLDAVLMIEPSRPRPLREGTLDLSEGVFTWRLVDGAEVNDESLSSPDEMAALRESAREAMWEIGRSGPAARSAEAIGSLAAMALLVGRGEPTLLFAPSRALSVDFARALALALTRRGAAHASATAPAPSPAAMLMARLMDCEPCRARETLLETLAAGVAFHNADLDDQTRALIEQGFNSGEILAVVATPTLGMGVNLIGRNVVQFPWRHAGSTRAAHARGQAARAPLGRARFLNQGGRAARLGLAPEGEPEPFGRSIVVGDIAETCDRLWEELIDAEIEPVDSALPTFPLDRAVLKVLAWNVEGSPEAVADTLCATWAAERDLAWAGPEQVESALARLIKIGAARRDPATANHSLTGLGESAVAAGIAPASAATYTHESHCEDLIRPPRGFTDPAWARRLLFILASSEEGRLAIANSGGRALGPAPDIDAPDDDLAEFERELFERPGGPSASERRAMILARALCDWISPMPTAEFETKWRVCHGGFARLAADYQWLARAMASLARRNGSPRECADAIEALAERLGPGIPDDAREIARLRVPGMSRGPLIALAQAGLLSPDAILEAPTAQLIDLIGLDLADRVESAAHERLARTAGINQLSPWTDQPRFPAQDAPASPGAKRRSRIQGDARLRHAPNINPAHSSRPLHRSAERISTPGTNITPATALAERPGEVVTRQSLYHRLWPGGGPEEQQLDGHRRKLIERLRPALGQAATHVAEVIRGVGFRLTWPDDQIALLR